VQEREREMRLEKKSGEILAVFIFVAVVVFVVVAVVLVVFC